MEKQKTKKKFCGFAECNDHCTRQSWKYSSNNFPDLPSAMAIALGKENLKKIKMLCRVPWQWHSAKKKF